MPPKARIRVRVAGAYLAGLATGSIVLFGLLLAGARGSRWRVDRRRKDNRST